MSVQAAILNLLLDVQQEFDTTLIFIAHDLSVVRFFSGQVAVMYLGQIMEIGPADAIYAPPYHPYSEALLSAVPIPDPTAEQKHIRLEGTVPSAIDPPSGCRGQDRHLPVVGSGKRLAGLVTRERLCIPPSELGSLNVWEITRFLSELTVKNVMVKEQDVITVGPDTALEEAAQIMVKHKIGCLPTLKQPGHWDYVLRVRNVRCEHWYPGVFERGNYDQWQAKGGKSLGERADRYWSTHELKEVLRLDLSLDEIKRKLLLLFQSDVIERGVSDIDFRGLQDGTL